LFIWTRPCGTYGFTLPPDHLLALFAANALTAGGSFISFPALLLAYGPS
jgi:hypothetical protein